MTGSARLAKFGSPTPARPHLVTVDPPLPSRRIGRLQRGAHVIHYEVTGAGPAIVFAHGLGGNQLSWWQQVAHFAPRYACITFAHRGFAPSSSIAGGPDPADYAGDLAALIEHLGLAEVRILAQSMGGTTAVEYALRHTGKLKALVLASTTGTIDRLMRARTRAPEELAAADCPVLFIVGDEDLVIPPFAADAIAAVVPQARALHIADAGHSVYFERAQLFNQHVADFLERAG